MCSYLNVTLFYVITSTPMWCFFYVLLIYCTAHLNEYTNFIAAQVLRVINLIKMGTYVLVIAGLEDYMKISLEAIRPKIYFRIVRSTWQ